VVPPRRGPAPRAPVFYNPAMALDRDIGVAVLTAWRAEGHPPVRAWEMLAATGVRGLRLLTESRSLLSLEATEANPDAFEVLRQNCARYTDLGARAHRRDAHAGPPDAPYGYVDLDPYGSPLPFLPPALAALSEGGLLAVTATDLMVLAGPQPEACLRKYGARPVRGWLGPEGGLRILLASVTRAAAERHLEAKVRLAYVLGHHLRAFVELRPSAGSRSLPLGSLPAVPEEEPPLGGTPPFGPMWLGPLFDGEFLARLARPPSPQEPTDLELLIARWREEASVPVPFAYEPNRVAAAAGLASPPPLEALLIEIRSRGFLAARSHLTASAFRTTAPYPDVRSAARAVEPSR
jgi:tRNA (guanine26-N2/guanine27-N2)-dimethyltransferase